LRGLSGTLPGDMSSLAEQTRDLATKADLREAIHELRSELLKWMFISQGAYAGLIITVIKLL